MPSRAWISSIKPDKVWRFVLASACPIVVLLSFGNGCSAFDECAAHERRCSPSGTIEECMTHPSGTDISADPPSVSHHDRSANTWESVGACGGADLCKTESVKDSYGVSKTDAFCVLSAMPDPACAGDAASGCDGTNAVECRAGFAIQAQLCKACGTACTGAVHDACTTDQDCAMGLVCDENKSCEMRCACADGAACDTCAALDRETVGPSRPVSFTWTCKLGICTELYGSR